MQTDQALTILQEWTSGDSLLRHAQTVGWVMEAYAKKFGEDPQLWASTGLLHDADYERYPDQHPQLIVNKLRDLGHDEMAYAISAHYTKWGNPQISKLDKALLACDELTGFIVACAQVRPQGLEGMRPKSVIKKLKQKSFAAKVDRQEIYAGVELLGVELNDHIQFIIEVLREHGEQLNL